MLKYLHQNNLIDGSCMTVTGRSLADNLATCPGLKEGQQVRQGPAPRLSGRAHSGGRPLLLLWRCGAGRKKRRVVHSQGGARLWPSLLTLPP